MNLTQNFLSRLDVVIQTAPDRWSARCPAHDDKSPSLSVRDAGDRVLFHCHAGCHPEDILKAIGLRWGDVHSGDRWAAAKNAGIQTAGHLSSRKRQREMRDGIDLELERAILRIVAADAKAGKSISFEDRARAQLARLRVLAAEGDAA